MARRAGDGFLSRLDAAEERDLGYRSRPPYGGAPAGSDSAGPSRTNHAAGSSSSSTGGVSSFTFGPGSLGITVQEVRGGTRIAIESVAPESQAAALGVPVGALLMSINGRIAKGMRLAQVGKMLAAAERPCTLHVLIEGANNKPASVSAAADDEDELSEQHGRPPAVPPPTRQQLLDAGRTLAPFSFGPGPLGVTLREEEGAVIIDTVADASAAHAQGLPPDGILVALNNADLLGLTKPEIGRMLGRAPRPMTLLIALPPPPPPKIISYTFGKGPMGLTLADIVAPAPPLHAMSAGSSHRVGSSVEVSALAPGSAAERGGGGVDAALDQRDGMRRAEQGHGG